MVRVKICGIKRVEEALLAAEAGADAIGMLVGQRHTSPDFISVETAQAIAGSLPAFVSPVLVTHAESLEELGRLIETVPVTTVQIHSEAPPEVIAGLAADFPYLKILKSYHVISEDSLSYGEPFRSIVDAFVLDTINLETNQVGGTGKTHDWSISRKIVERYRDAPVILAGGLNPENVADAIRQVGPFGVDVNSGTKGPDGFKDKAKLRAFISAAKNGSRFL